jgi:hypothetical protein
LLYPARAFELDQQKEVLAVIEANVVLVTANGPDIRRDLNDAYAGGVGKQHAPVDDVTLLPTAGIEPATHGLKPIPPFFQWRLSPDCESPVAEFLELLHACPSPGMRH